MNSRIFGENVSLCLLQYMVDLAVIYGADRERANKELTESLNFEIALANVSFKEGF